MLELRSYDGMKGFADGYFACFRQFKDYIEKEKDTEVAVEKMQNIVDFLEDFTLTQGDCGAKMADRKTEPQTEMEKSGSRAVQTARCLNCHNAKACKEKHWEVCKYEPWKLIAVEDEPQTDCRRCGHYATDKCKECSGYELFTDSGYVIDCSWR